MSSSERTKTCSLVNVVMGGVLAEDSFHHCYLQLYNSCILYIYMIIYISSIYIYNSILFQKQSLFSALNVESTSYMYRATSI